MSHFMLEEEIERVKFSKLGKPKLERQTAWQQGKHAKLYFDPLWAQQREPLITPIVSKRDCSFCTPTIITMSAQLPGSATKSVISQAFFDGVVWCHRHTHQSVHWLILCACGSFDN